MVDIQDLKVGMIVRAEKKSYIPFTWLEFIDEIPTKIATITRIHNGIVEIGTSESRTYKFYPCDLELDFQSVQLITLQKLTLSGIPKILLKKFVKHALEVSIHYAWDPIPANIAQQIAVDIGEADILQEFGFIEKQSIIKELIVDETTTDFDIIGILPNGEKWGLFKVAKDGSGFIRYGYILSNLGLNITSNGKLQEKETKK
jgi:hypothetical protein